MASVSASHLILFIASMLIAASVAGVLTDTVGRLSSAIDDQGLRVSEDVRTDVEVISDGASAVYNESGDDLVVVHVKNTGSETLAADATSFDVFLDGRYETELAVTLVGGVRSWRPNEVVRLEVDRSDAPLGTDSDHRMKLIVNDDEEVFEFRT